MPHLEEKKLHLLVSPAIHIYYTRQTHFTQADTPDKSYPEATRVIWRFEELSFGSCKLSGDGLLKAPSWLCRP